jgi:DNA polymerase zeta
MHLSKMKFRHPVPDTFSPWKFDGIGMQNQNMDKFTCMPNDFQVIFSSFLCTRCSKLCDNR